MHLLLYTEPLTVCLYPTIAQALCRQLLPGLLVWMEDRHPGLWQLLTLPPACLPSQVLIWNLDIGEPVKMIDCHTDVILCMSFNTDGSLLTTTCKDKKLRVIEPRSGRVLQVEHFVDMKEVLRGCIGEGGCAGAPFALLSHTCGSACWLRAILSL